MNYFYQNRAERKPHLFKHKESRGVIYPSMREILNRYRNGDNIDSFINTSPFLSGYARFEEYDDVIMRNRKVLDAFSKVVAEKRKKAVVEEKKERSDDADETKD